MFLESYTALGLDIIYTTSSKSSYIYKVDVPVYTQAVLSIDKTLFLVGKYLAIITNHQSSCLTTITTLMTADRRIVST